MRVQSVLLKSFLAFSFFSVLTTSYAEEAVDATNAATDGAPAVDTAAPAPAEPRVAPKPRVAQNTQATATQKSEAKPESDKIEKVEQTNKYVATNSVTGAELPANTQEAYIDPNAPKPDRNGYYPGATVYVSDKNRIWTRSGPSEGYRVTGSRQIGDALKFVRYSDNGRYAQLEADGEMFWMPLAALQPQITGYPLESKLRKEIADLQYRLDNYDSELSNRLKTAETELAKATKENSELKHTLANKESTIEELDTLYREYADRLETKELDMQMRWWTQGALIAFCGAIAGVVFVFIPRPTRPKKRERY